MKIKLSYALIGLITICAAGMGYVKILQLLDAERITENRLKSCPPQIFPATSDITHFDQITLTRVGLGPNYKITITGDGKVEYDGKSLVKTKGAAQAQLSRLQIEKLVSALNSAGYFSIPEYKWRNGCPLEGSLNQYTKTAVKIGSKTHELNGYGTSSTRPRQLSEFENAIEEIVSSEEWIGTPAEVEVYPAESHHHILARPSLSLISSQLGSLSNAFSHMLLVGTIKPEDFERLDFSYPGDIAYGDHNGIEIFNPDGLIKATPIAQELLDRVTLKQGTRLLYNLRRVETEKGEIRDTLYAILPDVDSRACSESSEASIDGGSLKHPLAIVTHASSIEIAANNQEVLIDKHFLPLRAVCIRSADKKNYKFFYLANRVKKNGSNQWQKPE